jgi:3-hydroxybutyryl-CoA dehydrogenase
MLVAVVTNDTLKPEWVAGGLQHNIEVIWLDEPALVPGATAYIDLLYSQTPDRLEIWQQYTSTLILINDVLKVNDQLPSHIIRFNGWPGFVNRPIIEMTVAGKEWMDKASSLCAAFNKTAECVPDLPGFVSARVVSMIINEAWFALEEEISTKEEIDIAMKLGTNYPYGPFEWGEKIGLNNVYQLLEALSVSQSRYTPAPLLKKEALRK